METPTTQPEINAELPNLTDLPAELVQKIAGSLDFREQFHLSLTCKRTQPEMDTELPSLTDLPAELVQKIAGSLDFREQFHLSLTCKRTQPEMDTELPSLTDLPAELVQKIAGSLDFREQFHLGLTCKRLRGRGFVFRRFAINLPLGRSSGVSTALEAALAHGAYFNDVKISQELGPEDRMALLELLLTAEKKAEMSTEARLHFFAYEHVAPNWSVRKPNLRAVHFHLLPTLDCFSALRGLRLVGEAADGNLAWLSKLRHLRILNLEGTQPIHPRRLQQIPILLLTDLRLKNYGQEWMQTWLSKLPVLPELLSLHIRGPVSSSSKTHSGRMKLSWNKVPALRWLEGDFVPGGIGELSCLERWLFLRCRGQEGTVRALGAVLANPARAPGRPLYAHAVDADQGLPESSAKVLLEASTLVWLKVGDPFPKDLYCPPVQWDNYKRLLS